MSKNCHWRRKHNLVFFGRRKMQLLNVFGRMTGTSNNILVVEHSCIKSKTTEGRRMRSIQRFRIAIFIRGRVARRQDEQLTAGFWCGEKLNKDLWFLLRSPIFAPTSRVWRMMLVYRGCLFFSYWGSRKWIWFV